jgi:hypothetical protein
MKEINNVKLIPEDYTEFLYWLKEKTEALWSEKVEEIIGSGMPNGLV